MFVLIFFEAIVIYGFRMKISQKHFFKFNCLTQSKKISPRVYKRRCLLTILQRRFLPSIYIYRNVKVNSYKQYLPGVSFFYGCVTSSTWQRFRNCRCVHLSVGQCSGRGGGWIITDLATVELILDHGSHRSDIKIYQMDNSSEQLRLFIIYSKCGDITGLVFQSGNYIRPKT